MEVESSDTAELKPPNGDDDEVDRANVDDKIAVAADNEVSTSIDNKDLKDTANDVKLTIKDNEDVLCDAEPKKNDESESINIITETVVESVDVTNSIDVPNSVEVPSSVNVTNSVNVAESIVAPTIDVPESIEEPVSTNVPESIDGPKSPSPVIYDIEPVDGLESIEVPITTDDINVSEANEENVITETAQMETESTILSQANSEVFEVSVQCSSDAKDQQSGNIVEIDQSKDANLLQMLSSPSDRDIPSQTDKWNESIETIDDGTEDDADEMDDEEIEEEMEDEELEEEEEYESDVEMETNKSRSNVRPEIKESEVFELSDDDEDDYPQQVDKKPSYENEYEDSDSDVASISDDEDVDDYESINSVDNSEKSSESEDNEQQQQQSKAKQQTDKKEKITETERNSNCVNSISLRLSEADPQINDYHDKENNKSADEQQTLEKSNNQENETDSKMNVVVDVAAKDKNKNKADAKVSIIEVMEISDHDDVVTDDLFNDPPVRNDEKPPPNLATSNKGTNENLAVELNVGEPGDKQKNSQIVNGSVTIDKSISDEVIKPIEPPIIKKDPVERNKQSPATEQNEDEMELLNGEDTTNKSEIKDEVKNREDVTLTEQPDENHLTKPSEETATTTSKKRKASTSADDEGQPPAKNLRTELESNLVEYDKLLHGLINETTKSNDPDNIQNDIDQLNQDIEALTEAARIKELEWNNILYLKKMKEDMMLRIMRKKTVMDIMSNKINDDIDGYNSLESNESHDNDGAQQNNVNANNHNLANSKTTMILAAERLNMNSSDLAKERSNINRMHRNIQPKVANQPENSNAANTLITNYMTSMSQEFLQHRLRQETQNQANNKLQFGRQGPIKDVKSLIDDYRQRNPEVIPRRGRRMKNVTQQLNNDHSLERNADLDLLLGRSYIRPSSNDSSHNNSAQNLTAGNIQRNANDFGVSITDSNSSPLTSTPLLKQSPASVGYPEVTLHPIKSSGQQTQLKQKGDSDLLAHQSQSSSLLHGILTKSVRQQKGNSTRTSPAAALSTAATAGYNNTCSPTLARLLTAPERNLAVGTAAVTASRATNHFFAAQPAEVNLTKNQLLRTQQQQQQQSQQPEISFVPISQIMAHQQQLQSNSLLQQQLQRQRENARFNSKCNAFMNMDDEADDSVDRLVIDEGEHFAGNDMNAVGIFPNDDGHENELPECQGCKKREAQFVCADCQRQWYCSRECQVVAWDEHSEVCSR